MSFKIWQVLYTSNLPLQPLLLEPMHGIEEVGNVEGNDGDSLVQSKMVSVMVKTSGPARHTITGMASVQKNLSV